MAWVSPSWDVPKRSRFAAIIRLCVRDRAASKPRSVRSSCRSSAGAAVKFAIIARYSASTGVVPVGVPSPSKVIAATFSSASFSLASQRFLSLAPRSYSAIESSKATSPRSSWPTTCSSSFIACSKDISFTSVSVISAPCQLKEYAHTLSGLSGGFNSVDVGTALLDCHTMTKTRALWNVPDPEAVGGLAQRFEAARSADPALSGADIEEILRLVPDQRAVCRGRLDQRACIWRIFLSGQQTAATREWDELQRIWPE